MVLNLGIDRLHTDQAQAEAIQKALRITPTETPRADAVVSIGRDGKARLKALVVNGQRTDLAWM